NALRSVTDECYVALMKSAYSTNIKERHDHSTAILDADGRLVVQAAESLPIHIASMYGLMACLLEKFGDDIREGDLFVANDPHVAGGTHLPDVNMAMPVFADGELVAFVCNIAHHADIGGMAPGSMAGGMSEIYQEGLRIPVIRLFREGELQHDILDLLLLNVRVPAERRGDYFAQIAACRLGRRRLLEVVAAWSTPLVKSAFAEILARTERRLRDAIRAVPDGRYEFEDVLDGDGVETWDIPIRLAVDVEGDRIRFDFTGSSPQVDGNVNVTLNATQAAVCYSLKALLDPAIPNNQGVLDVAEIVAGKGSLLNAAFPAPVASRAHTCQRIIDVVLGAMAKALPERVIAAANGANTTAVFAGRDPLSGESYLYLETLGGGMGARATRDGKDGVQVHITNTSNLPVEAIETEYPLLVESYGLIEDSGGAGRQRGGSGLRRVVRPRDHTCVFNGVGERFRHQPWGLFGGAPGSSGRFLLRSADGSLARLPDKPGEVRVRPDEAIVVETPGAGGYGPPSDRDPGLVRLDWLSGKFTVEYLRRHYRWRG
ncbi:MAG: hydantoinase B/oxoprolinase family protein, partial [Gammaproteobacteria bacterium]|nr:hydantoinase B/oxoprolinase family protein [Gammaproteobacteria bacterium]